MDRRYDFLKANRKRTIADYNEYARENGLNIMPYIVVIIDEFADLMNTASDSLEVTVQRLTQKARSIGIHLIIATQRPSTDVISGTIKNNISCRIALKVKSYVDLNLNSQNPEFKLKSVTKQSKNALSAIYQNNLALIKTIPSNIIERYRSAYLNNVNNFDREQIYRLAKTYQGISNRRAKIIARDQTQKAVSSFAQARAEQLGFEYYEWVTAGDERVSEEHKHLNGRVYRYDTPTAKIDSYGLDNLALKDLSGKTIRH